METIKRILNKLFVPVVGLIIAFIVLFGIGQFINFALKPEEYKKQLEQEKKQKIEEIVAATVKPVIVCTSKDELITLLLIINLSLSLLK